jgi:hypothetical protein
MSDALLPLRHAYGMEAPQPRDGARAVPAAGLVETDLLQQSRALLDALPRVAPEAQVLDEVLNEARRQSAEALRPLAAIAAAYEVPMDEGLVMGSLAEAASHQEMRGVLDRWQAAHRWSPETEVLETVLTQAEMATRLAPPADGPVGEEGLLPLAAAYGLPTLRAADSAAPHAETSLLRSTRAALDALPREQPSGDVLAAVLARAEATTLGRPARRMPDRAAADRSASRQAAPRRRVGLWAGAASLAGALVLALALLPTEQPGTLGAPSLVTVEAPPPQDRGGSLVETPAAAMAPSGTPAAAMQPLVAFAPTPGAAPAGRVARPSFEAGTRGEAALVPASVKNTTRPAAEPQAVASALDAAPSPRPAEESWDLPNDHRVLSLRLQEIRRANEGLAWDAPAEAFGAPAPRSATASPGIQVVREGAAPARARLYRDSTRTPNR